MHPLDLYHLNSVSEYTSLGTPTTFMATLETDPHQH